MRHFRNMVFATLIAWPVTTMALDAQTTEPAIVHALDVYTALPTGGAPLVLVQDGEFVGQNGLPAWLARVALTDQEALALVAAISAWRLDPVVEQPGTITTTRARRRTVLEYAAALAGMVEIARQDQRNQTDDLSKLQFDADGNRTRVSVGPARYLARAARYAELLDAMGSCPGALVSAWHRLKQDHAGAPITQELETILLHDGDIFAPPSPACPPKHQPAH